MGKNKKVPPKNQRLFKAVKRRDDEGFVSPPAYLPGIQTPWETHLLLMLGFVLVGGVLLQNDAFLWLAPSFKLPPAHLRQILLLGAVFLFLGFRGLPTKPLPLDIPRWAAYPLLLAFLGVAAYFRLYRAGEPIGRYWDDPAICIIDPCDIFELHVFRIDFAIGHREPLYPYVAAGIWWLFPQMKALVVERVTSTLFDVAAVWLFYRLGREVTGRRLTGILLAAFGAVSKPMILQNLGGMPGLTLPFITSLILWFQFRLFRKPDLSHFLQWGFILGFGFYTYIAYRPWMLFLAFSTLAWMAWDSFIAPRFSPDPAKTVPKGKARAPKTSTPAPRGVFRYLGINELKNPSPILAGVHWLLLALGTLGLLSLFAFLLDRLFVVFTDNPLSRIWRSNLHVWIFFQILLFGIFGYLYKMTSGKGKTFMGWCLGVALAGFLVYPLAMNAEIGIKIRDISILPKSPLEWLRGSFIHSIWERFSIAVWDLFVTGDDRADMNVVGDPFFDFHAAVLVLAGLVFAISRFSWTRIFLILCAFTGVVGRILTGDPTSAKLLGALPALLLLSCWGLENWIAAAFSGPWKKRWIGLILTVVLGFFWVWEGQGTFERVYVKWWSISSSDVIVYQEISRQIPTKRVYMGVYHGMGFASPAVQGVIFDGQPLYLLGQNNIIDVTPGEPRQDLAVVISGADKDWAGRLKKDFPHAQWLPQWAFYQTRSDTPFLYTVVIPEADIPQKPGKLFMLRVVPEHKWLRRVYSNDFGLCRGMILYEDLSESLNPIPPGMGSHSISAEGDWEVPADGNYTFSVDSANPLQVWVDGDKVLSSVTADWVRPRNVSHTVFLKKGIHRLRYLTYLRSAALFDRVTIINSQAGFKESLGG